MEAGKMTIAEAAQVVLQSEDKGLTCKEITEQILKRNLYQFHTDNPCSVVLSAIRRRCEGLDFPAAYPVKFFKIIAGKGRKTTYQLLEYTQSENIDNVHMRRENGGIVTDSEMLPVEKMQKVYEKHLAELQSQLYEYIMANDPAFFERLVLNLLLRLGYGYGNEAGKVVGKSHDGGIDGVINEDKLGLDKIYIQAKRYAKDRKVGRKDIQAFVGAMTNTKKGVFITTSSFTPEAVQYVERSQEKSISLINGAFLCELMVKYGVGVKPVDTFPVYEIDSDFFNV